MSKTPRTDEHLRMKEENGHAVIVSGDFARQLETELADARAEIERKDQLIEQMREALNVLVAGATPSGPLWHGSTEMQIARAALSAAERGKRL